MKETPISTALSLFTVLSGELLVDTTVDRATSKLAKGDFTNKKPPPINMFEITHLLLQSVLEQYNVLFQNDLISSCYYKESKRVVPP